MGTAISLSPVWFLMPCYEGGFLLEGNFSPLAGRSQLQCRSAVDFELKRDIASRMLQFPGTVEKHPLLEFALRRLSSGSRGGSAGFLRDLAVWKDIHRRLGVAGPLRLSRAHSVCNECCSGTTATKAGSADLHREIERTQHLDTSRTRKCACES